MKRRRINLLSLTLKKFDFETTAKKLQFSLIVMLILLVCGLVGTSFLNNYLIQQTDAIARSKQPLLLYFQSNKDFDKKVGYFIYKNNLLKDYLKGDAKAYVYYVDLLQHISSVSPEAQVLVFTVDNVGQTEFDVSFPSYESAQIFLNAIEKPEFIKPFEYIKLGDFEITTSKDSQFTLNIEGKFIKK
jgi:hypothetical protein